MAYGIVHIKQHVSTKLAKTDGRGTQASRKTVSPHGACVTLADLRGRILETWPIFWREMRKNKKDGLYLNLGNRDLDPLHDSLLKGAEVHKKNKKTKCKISTYLSY